MKLNLIAFMAILTTCFAQGGVTPGIIGGRKKRRKFGSSGLIIEGGLPQDAAEKEAYLEGLKTGNLGDVGKTKVINGEFIEEQKAERKPSMVKLPGRDEYLLLPDRESVLKFKTFADFATEDDVDNQEDQRNEAWWGRMYMKGMPFSIQYFR